MAKLEMIWGHRSLLSLYFPSQSGEPCTGLPLGPVGVCPHTDSTGTPEFPAVSLLWGEQIFLERRHKAPSAPRWGRTLSGSSLCLRQHDNTSFETGDPWWDPSQMSSLITHTYTVLQVSRLYEDSRKKLVIKGQRSSSCLSADEWFSIGGGGDFAP